MQHAEAGRVDCSNPAAATAGAATRGGGGGGGGGSGTRSDPDGPKNSRADDRASKDEWSPYKILGVATDATDGTIRHVFRRESLKVHPDRHPDDPQAAEKFRELTEAKNFLLDPRKRRAYNFQHGLLQTTQGVKWWSDWEDILDEITPAEDCEELTNEAVPATISADSRIDIIVFGATGIIGLLACMELQRRFSSYSWAIAGRDLSKLELLKQKLGSGARFRGVFRAETSEEIGRAAQSARIAIDCTGPKWRLDGFIAESCVSARTHYIDITGCAGDCMVAKRVQERLDGQAKAAGVCLTFFCGWSSAQVDFGVWRIVKHLRDRHGLSTRAVRAYRWMHGSLCWGGTHMVSYCGDADFDGAFEPFLLGGVRPGGLRKEDEDEKGCVEDTKYSGMWVTMDNPPDNVVPRLTCKLFDACEPYGDNFLYKNWGIFPDKRSGQTSVMGNKFLRAGYKQAVADKKVPPPGTGAKERLRQESYVTMLFAAETDADSDNQVHSAYLTLTTGPGGMGDPYECTAVVAVEAAECLLRAIDAGRTSDLRAGFGTPAYHLAHLGLLDRLIAQGNSYHIEDGAPAPEVFHRIFAAALPIAN